MTRNKLLLYSVCAAGCHGVFEEAKMARRKKTILIAGICIFVIIVAALALCFVFRPGPAVPAVNGPGDPARDLFDQNGTPAAGEAYLDITAVDIQKSGNQYVMLMQVNGPLPSKTPEKSTYIEWDFMIDADKNPNTGTRWPLISNDIGYDYLVRLGLYGNHLSHEVLNVKANGASPTNLKYRVIQNVVELTVPESAIGTTSSFNWTAAVRKYLSGAQPAQPTISDKVPDKGHFSYPAAAVPSAPSEFAGTLNGSWTGQVIGNSSTVPVAGTFTVTIDSGGVVQGTFEGAFSGTIAGQIDINGNLDAQGTALIGTNSMVTSWQGKLSRSGAILSGQGNWTGDYASGSFSGNGSTTK